jgi:predicted phosphate transport protein (TIGR00153 family)
MLWWKTKKSFFEYFEEHAKEIERASALLYQLFEGTNTRESTALQIRQIEHQADAIVRSVITQLNTSSFILPLDHEDILNLTKALDDIVDDIDDSAESFVEIYDLKQSTDKAKEFASLILQASKVLKDSCSLLFKPAKYADQILFNCEQLHQIEHQGDELKKESLKQLFENLKTGKVDIAFYLAWNQLYHTLEEVTDKFDDCANVAEQIVTKYS